MNGLYLQYEKAPESTKDGKKVNVLCIVNQNHEESVVSLTEIMVNLWFR